MTINLTPDIQSQIYMDKRDGYLLSMVEKLTPKIEVESQPQEKEDEKKNSFFENDDKNKPFFKESDFTFNSTIRERSLNSSIGSTQNFFNTLSSAGGSVQKAS